MYKTTGMIDKKFYDSIKCNLLPQKVTVLLKICVAMMILCYILFAFIYHDFFWTCLSVYGISLFMIVFKFIVEKYVKINLDRMQENFHTDFIEYCSEFTEDAIIIFSNVREEMGQIYYSDLSRIILTPKCYLIFTKAEQIICVFPEHLQEREKLGIIGFLKEKSPKIKVYKDRSNRKFVVITFMILLYLSFLVFLFDYFTKPEAVINDTDNAQTEIADSEILVNASEGETYVEDTETLQIPVTEIKLRIANPSLEYYSSEDVLEAESPSISLDLVYEVENDITDLDLWLETNNLTAPQLPYNDEKYFYALREYIMKQPIW